MIVLTQEKDLRLIVANCNSRIGHNYRLKSQVLSFTRVNINIPNCVGESWLYLVRQTLSPLLDIIVVDNSRREIYDYRWYSSCCGKTSEILSLSVQWMRYMNKPNVFYLGSSNRTLKVTVVVQDNHRLAFILKETKENYLTLPIHCGYNKYRIVYE